MKRTVAGKILNLEHSPPQMEFMDNFQSVGGKVWPASDLLINYLHQTSYAKNKRILELGSGCGYVGIACGALGADRVTLTDRVMRQRRMEHDAEGMLMEYEMEPNRMLLNVCESNIARNRAETEGTLLDVQELEWGEDNSQHIDRIFKTAEFDVIIGSDVTYNANLSHSLFWTVSQLLQRQERSNSSAGKSVAPVKFLASHQFRMDSATALTLSTAREFGLQCTTLATSSSSKGEGSRDKSFSHATERAKVSAVTTASSASAQTAARPPTDSDPTRNVQYHYQNAEGVEEDFALWEFTLQS
jgi:predicted RNA methylase